MEVGLQPRHKIFGKLVSYKEPAMSCTATFSHAHAQTWGTSPPKDGTRVDKLPPDFQGFFQRPTTGRTTRMGRRVEKPGDAAAAGPSGQHDTTHHDRQHTNK
jgi:hypothetical protein